MRDHIYLSENYNNMTDQLYIKLQCYICFEYWDSLVAINTHLGDDRPTAHSLKYAMYTVFTGKYAFTVDSAKHNILELMNSNHSVRFVKIIKKNVKMRILTSPLYSYIIWYHSIRVRVPRGFPLRDLGLFWTILRRERTAIKQYIEKAPVTILCAK